MWQSFVKRLARVWIILWLSACAAVTPTVFPTAVAPTEIAVLTRSELIDPELFDAFTRETGVKVFETTYLSDFEVPDRLKGEMKFDLVVCSDFMIAALRRDIQLAQLNLSNIPNFQNVEARLKNPPFDPGNHFSVPLVWGTTGILYRTDQINARSTQRAKIDSWDVVFDSARSEELSIKAALFDQPRSGLGAALKYLGFSLNSQDRGQLSRAKELLSQPRGAIVTFDSSAWSDLLLSGQVNAAQARSDDAALTQFNTGDLRYAIPKEGAPLWMDNFAIPKNGRHPSQAETLINFMLRSDHAARAATYSFSLPVIADAYNHMDAAKLTLYRSGYIPDEATFKRLEFIADVGAAQQEYDRIWLELK